MPYHILGSQNDDGLQTKPIGEVVIAVSPPCNDDMLSVFKRMGLPAYQAPYNMLQNLQYLRRVDIFGANCGSFQGAYCNPQDVRQWIANGGKFLGSDFEDEPIQKCFPGIIMTDRNGAAGILLAQVVDPELEQIIGSQIQLNFDMGSWHRITRISSKEVGCCGHIVSPVTVHLESEGRPIVVSFKYGRGHVIYTSFHVHAQATEMEEALIKLLLLKPLSLTSGIPTATLYRQFGQG
ncbi:hypothetical protein HYR54_15820 [Candidatus Acetothermia bacterium]|nr:hypothetical protein [Candidatus Acetothermia bacterium]